MVMTVLSKVQHTTYLINYGECSIKVYNHILAKRLALCLMVLATYYAQNYAGIIG